MAALLLSRYCQFAMAGGDGAEPGSGEKMAARLLLAAAEFQQQPLVQRFAATLAESGDAVTALLQETLSGTLAMDDLDAISARLQATGSPRVDAQTLSAIGRHIRRRPFGRHSPSVTPDRIVEGHCGGA